MVFDFLRPLQAESVVRLSVYQFVDEVGGLHSPARGDFVFLYAYLLGKNVVADLLAVLAHIRPLAKHAFVGNHAHCEVVNSDAVVLTTHNFWRHVAGRARSILGIFRVPDARNSKVGDS